LPQVQTAQFLSVPAFSSISDDHLSGLFPPPTILDRELANID